MTAKKYISMTEEEINQLDKPNNYKQRERVGNNFVNIIYKMMVDGYDDETIYFYIRKIRGEVSPRSLREYIMAISKENFPNRKRANSLGGKDLVYPDDVTVIRRNSLLKFLLTIDLKKRKDKVIEENIEIIKDKYPIIIWVSDTFKQFHDVLMGKNPDKLDEFINQHEKSKISSFCSGLKKDIAPVKNAITSPVSSGFVEGNNNKFKLIKRIVYGRSGNVNLEKKCMLAFMSKSNDFHMSDLI